MQNFFSLIFHFARWRHSEKAIHGTSVINLWLMGSNAITVVGKSYMTLTHKHKKRQYL